MSFLCNYNMVNIVNNVDLEKVSQTAEKGKEDKTSLKKPVNFKENGF